MKKKESHTLSLNFRIVIYSHLRKIWCFSSGNHFINECYLGVYISVKFLRLSRNGFKRSTGSTLIVKTPDGVVPLIKPCQPRSFIYGKNGNIESSPCSIAIGTKQIPIDCSFSPTDLTFFNIHIIELIWNETMCKKNSINKTHYEMRRPTIRCWRHVPQSANLVVGMPLCFSFKVAETSIQYNTCPGDRLNDFGFNIGTF